MSGWALQQSFYSIPHVPESRNPHFHYTFHHHNSCYCCCFVLFWLVCPLILFPWKKTKSWPHEEEEEEERLQSHDCGVLCVSSPSPNSEWHMGRLLPHSLPPPPILAGVWEGVGGGKQWGGGGFQRWCSNGLLMWAMLRMMELRGLTNFGKSEQEEESRGGDLGPFVTACLILEFKKMAQRCCEI